MLSDLQFNMRLNSEMKRKLEFLAAREGRSKANMVKSLIREKFEAVAVKSEKVEVKEPEQEQPAGS